MYVSAPGDLMVFTALHTHMRTRTHTRACTHTHAWECIMDVRCIISDRKFTIIPQSVSNGAYVGHFITRYQFGCGIGRYHCILFGTP